MSQGARRRGRQHRGFSEHDKSTTTTPVQRTHATVTKPQMMALPRITNSRRSPPHLGDTAVRELDATAAHKFATQPQQQEDDSGAAR